ncbi:hypothetical protein NPX13_g2468 [Xylaria arbuscula]|uniref:MADS-box domain-containing protein n=1 Tax=Xylaria arbuscula TaxID=114810 RepID=A0A9W8NKP0_9PEZI|nr:hypothetical protein NPX13_g2468 [Xylaria arbuscula]
MARLQNRNHNRKAALSLANRQRGIFKKSNTLRRMYGGEIAIYIKQQDGYTICYESRVGILNEACFAVPNESFGPDDFDTITDRRSTPVLPTGIPAMARQFFGVEDNFDPSFTEDPSMAIFGSTPVSWNDATTASTSSSNCDGQDPYAAALGPVVSSPLDHFSQEQPMDSNDGAISDAFYVPDGYIFPSSLLSNQSRGDSCVSTSRSSTSLSSLPSSSSPLPTTPSQSLFLPADPASLESDTVSVVSPRPTFPHSQQDLVSLIEEYTKN